MWASGLDWTIGAAPYLVDQPETGYESVVDAKAPAKKQKVLPAHRAGLKEVIIPMRNEGDLEDVPEQVREEIVFHPVETIDEVLAIALDR